MNALDALIAEYGFSKDENPVSTIIVGGAALAARGEMADEILGDDVDTTQLYKLPVEEADE